MMRSRETRRLSSAVERTCMADKGYSRYEVSDSVLRDIRAIRTEDERLEQLFGLASSSEPIGRRIAE